jgi:eukaryotic-like serine/threonine-protein kinase
MALSAGTRLGPYEILAPIGQGGMGEVYRARDTRLGREVAIKLVLRELARGDFRERFQREARAISALNHAHICSLHDIGEQDGLDYLVMEYVEGESLADVLKRGALPLPQVLQYAAETADAFAAAHARGIVHRDLKPANIMITTAGVKVLDFGLAKRSDRAESQDAATVTIEAETSAGQVLGTVAYMSPEQAEGRSLDTRSDIFSLGVVMYEMLCGQRPFRGGTTLALLASILREQPEAPRRLRPETPPQLERIVLRCLAKKPEDRYASAAELRGDLEACRKTGASSFTLRKSLAVAAALVLLAALGAAGTWWLVRASRLRWADTVALPEARELREHIQPLAASRLLHQAERYAPSSSGVLQLKEDLPLWLSAIDTTPEGADIYAIDYANPKDGDASQWEHLGRSPLKTDRLPRDGYYRLRVVKDGFETVEWATGARHTFRIPLHTREETPLGMVWIPGPPAAWLDKYEVSNRQFKAFVDAGGYQKPQYWKQPFVKDGKNLSWEQAMAEFRDATGRAGPSTWQAGSYPDGKADFPVSGVSWYEAAAYAEFAGKSLPTLTHWYAAAGRGSFNSQILLFSNFGGQGPARSGSNRGLAPFGAYDMAGNVKEWVWNPSGEKRLILGGGWNEPNYMFQQADALPPFDRDAQFGFRCARYVSPVSEKLTGPVEFSRGRKNDKPVDDQAYKIFLSILAYDKTDLKAAVDSTTDAPHWRRERVSFQAAYGNERVIAYLYLPKNAAPPYQIVVFFPQNTIGLRTPEEIWPVLADYIVKSGRALILPVYKGTLERTLTAPVTGPKQTRDLLVQGIQDLGRSLDYLETRADIDSAKLGYYGFSFGGAMAPVTLAAQPRFKAAVLVSAGVINTAPPEVSAWNYAPRIRTPVLMLMAATISGFRRRPARFRCSRRWARRRKTSAASSTMAATSTSSTAWTS